MGLLLPMKVQVLKSFVGPGMSYVEGERAELPNDENTAGWIRAGLIEPLEELVETAAMSHPPARFRKKK